MATPVVGQHGARSLDEIRPNRGHGGWQTKRLQGLHEHLFREVFGVGCIPDLAKDELVDAYDVVLVDGLPIGVDRGLALRWLVRLWIAEHVELSHRQPSPLVTQTRYVGTLQSVVQATE